MSRQEITNQNRFSSSSCSNGDLHHVRLDLSRGLQIYEGILSSNDRRNAPIIPRKTTRLRQIERPSSSSSSSYHSTSRTISSTHSSSSPRFTVSNHLRTSSSPRASNFSHASCMRTVSLFANARQGSVIPVPRGGMLPP